MTRLCIAILVVFQLLALHTSNIYAARSSLRTKLSLLSRTRADPSAAGGQAPLSASSAPPLIIPPQVVPPVASTPVTVESDIEKGKVMLERVSGQIDQDTATLHEWDQILQDYEFKRAQLKKRNDQNQVIQTDLTNQLNKLQGAADGENMETQLEMMQDKLAAMSETMDDGEKYKGIIDSVESVKDDLLEQNADFQDAKMNIPAEMSTTSIGTDNLVDSVGNVDAILPPKKKKK